MNVKNIAKKIALETMSLGFIFGPPAVTTYFLVESLDNRRIAERAFTRYDTNLDNVLDEQELNNYFKGSLQKMIDGNQDGVIDIQELNASLYGHLYSDE